LKKQIHKEPNQKSNEELRRKLIGKVKSKVYRQNNKETDQNLIVFGRFLSVQGKKPKFNNQLFEKFVF